MKRNPTNTWKYWMLTLSDISGDKNTEKEYLRRTRKLLETKLNSRKLNKGINTWPVHPCKILLTILEVGHRRT